MNNPIENMSKYPRSKLDGMDLGELLAAQRDCLYPHEQRVFDSERIGGFVFAADEREDFFEYTDRLIVRAMLREVA